MLKGLAITPPVLGRISIGLTVENSNGKRVPKKDDEFTLTSLVKTKGEWVGHPLDAKLRTGFKQGEKLRSIPIRLMFNDPALNFRAEYSLFDRETGRPVCVGNGETCRRSTAEGIKVLGCPSPDGCDIGRNKQCKPFGRLNVRVDAGEEVADELGGFIFRTTGFNSIRTLTARMSYIDAISGGGVLAHMPLELRLRGKSTTQSHGSAVYFVDLVPRAGLTMAAALAKAKEAKAAAEAAGLLQDRLEEAVRAGLRNGAFEESAEDGADVAEEFFPAEQAQSDYAAAETAAPPEDQAQSKPPLPPYREEVMQNEMPAMKKMVAAGKKTPEGLIAFLSTKYHLTDDQKAEILSIATTPATPA